MFSVCGFVTASKIEQEQHILELPPPLVSFLLDWTVNISRIKSHQDFHKMFGITVSQPQLQAKIIIITYCSIRVQTFLSISRLNAPLAAYHQSYRVEPPNVLLCQLQISVVRKEFFCFRKDMLSLAKGFKTLILLLLKSNKSRLKPQTIYQLHLSTVEANLYWEGMLFTHKMKL